MEKTLVFEKRFSSEKELSDFKENDCLGKKAKVLGFCSSCLDCSAMSREYCDCCLGGGVLFIEGSERYMDFFQGFGFKVSSI